MKNDYTIKEYVDGVPVKKYRPGYAQDYVPVQCSSSDELYEQLDEDNDKLYGMFDQEDTLCNMLKKVGKGK